MKSYRAYSTEENDRVARAARLRPVTRSTPPRPRWGRLYLALIAMSVLGAAGHLLVEPAVLLEVIDAGFALALFGVLTGWIHLNRQALARLHEPDAGVGTPQIRVLRSHR